MPVPRRRHCPARQGKRRAHVKLFAPQLVPCEECGQLKRRHHICAACGTYKKKPIVETGPTGPTL